MKNFKIILYILPLFICFSLISFKGYCNALPDYILDQNSLSVVQGELTPIEEYGLSSGHVNLFTLPIFITEKLNPYLYQTYGWDIDDVADLALTPLDPTSSTAQEGIKLWSTFDNTLNNAQSIGSALENGFRVLEMKTIQAGQLSRLLGQNAKAYCLGKINEASAGVNAFVSNVKDNILVKLGSDFSDVWSDNYDGLVDNGDIIDLSSFGFTYGNSFYFNQSSGGNTFYYQVYFDEPQWICTNGKQVYVCTQGSDASLVSINGSGAIIYPQGTYPVSGWAIDTYYNSTYITVDSTTYCIGPLQAIASFGRTGIYSDVAYGTVSDLSQFFQNDFDNNLGFSLPTFNTTVEGTPFNLQQILSQLDGKYVTSEQLGGIKTILDNNAITNTQADGAGQIFTDDTLQDLIDLINGIINQQDDLEDALPDPDPEPDPEPDPDYNDMGISVPPDYPTQSFDTVNDIIRSPLEFFSIFEPIFLIFGNSALIIFGLWLFVPCVIIIGFIIWALK